MTRQVAVPQWSVPVLTMIALVVAWQAFTALFPIPTWLLPSPVAIANVTAQWQQQLPLHIGVTLYETLAGFLLAIAVGVPLAVLIVFSPFLAQTIYPILIVLQSVPKVAIAPLLLVWIGYGELPKILVVFLVAFFPIVVSTATGLIAVEPDMLDMVRSLSATRLQTFVKLRFPSAMPHIFVGLKVAITLAVVGAVIGEFVGSDRGLGYLILVSTAQINTPLAFSSMVILSIMSIVLFYGLEALERLVIPWAQDD